MLWLDLMEFFIACQNITPLWPIRINICPIVLGGFFCFYGVVLDCFFLANMVWESAGIIGCLCHKGFGGFLCFGNCDDWFKEYYFGDGFFLLFNDSIHLGHCVRDFFLFGFSFPTPLAVFYGKIYCFLLADWKKP